MFALLVSVPLTIELFRRLRLAAAVLRLARVAQRAIRLLRRRASDHWKEKALLAIAGRMLLAALVAGGLLALAALPMLAAVLLDRPLGLGSTAVLLDWSGRLTLLAFGVCYVVFRRWIGRVWRRRSVAASPGAR
jgi:hypothetical protein